MNKKLKGKIIEVYGTQADFAQQRKIPEHIISRVINGRHVLSTKEKKQWGKYLKCKMEDFFSKEEK